MRLREARWVPAQVALLGQMECRTPDPLYVLDIAGRYQVDDRAVRRARRALTPRQRAELITYQERQDEYVQQTDQNGRRFLKSRPPEMRPEEADAFRALWRVLWYMDALRRITPTRPPPETP